jgi:pimeloyl-ACP methyl ester carboxylesterase
VTESVVLLHGLARTSRAMRPMAQALQAAGYAVYNIDYPSRDYPVEELARQVFEPLASQLNNPACRVHFVTHSMGGILLRYHLSKQQPAGLGRTVMLSPPSQGSEVVDKLGDLAVFQWINGPAGAQLGTGADSLPLQLGPADFDVGIITGNRSINLLLSQLIPGPDDGKVSVARARLEGMRDFLVMPYSHPFIMRREAVIKQTLHYLRHGRFIPMESSA